MYNIKIGDIIFCKNNRQQFEYNIIFYAGKSYTITDIDDNCIYINGIAFMIKFNHGAYSFNEYFYTKKEYRKLKLEKLNNTWKLIN